MRVRITLLGIAAALLAMAFQPYSIWPWVYMSPSLPQVAVPRDANKPLQERVGINIVYANVPSDIAQVAGWVRDYHRWYWYAPQKGQLLWHNSKQRLDYFYPSLNKLGLNVMVNVGMVPAWASSNGSTSGLPHPKGASGSKPGDYRDHAEYLGQLAARYGSTRHTSGLTTSDGLSGLGVVKAIEGWNEPNQSWAQPLFPAPAFAAMIQADYDGAGITAGKESTLAGIKRGDQSMITALPGLAGPDDSYLDQANLTWKSRGKLPFDVLNFHWFAKGQAGTGGKAPELGGLGEAMEKMSRWRDKAAPGMPIWLTEIGWDTNSRSGARPSPLYAPEETAAAYIIRAIFLALSNGADKVFVFTYRDHDSESSEQYSTSGLVENTEVRDGQDSRKKAGWYYMATLKNTLGRMVLGRMDQQRDSFPAKYIFRLVEPGSGREAVVAWTRNPRAERDDRSVSLPEYELLIPAAKRARSTRFETGLVEGRKRELEVLDSGTAEARAKVALSETPLIVEYWLDAAPE